MLNENVIVVVPASVREEQGGWTVEAEVRHLRQMLGRFRDPRFNHWCRFPTTYAWLQRVETDPNTQIVVPEEVLCKSNLWRKETLGALRLERDRQRHTGAAAAFLASLEVAEPEIRGVHVDHVIIDDVRDDVTDPPCRICHAPVPLLHRWSDDDGISHTQCVKLETGPSTVAHVPEHRARPYREPLSVLADVQWQEP